MIISLARAAKILGRSFLISTPNFTVCFSLYDLALFTVVDAGEQGGQEASQRNGPPKVLVTCKTDNGSDSAEKSRHEIQDVGFFHIIQFSDDEYKLYPR